MMEQPLATFFGPIGIMYGLIVPLVLVLLLGIFFAASILSPTARPSRVAQAAYCAILMGVGILMMRIAAIPTVWSVLAGVSYATVEYVGLLILFACGGALFLWHDNWMRSLDTSSSMVSSLMFVYTVKAIGTITAVLTGLSLLLTFILGNAEEGWWTVPLTFLLYGVVLMMSTRSEASPMPPIFSSFSIKNSKKTATVAITPLISRKKQAKK